MWRIRKRFPVEMQRKMSKKSETICIIKKTMVQFCQMSYRSLARYTILKGRMRQRTAYTGGICEQQHTVIG